MQSPRAGRVRARCAALRRAGPRARCSYLVLASFSGSLILQRFSQPCGLAPPPLLQTAFVIYTGRTSVKGRPVVHGMAQLRKNQHTPRGGCLRRLAELHRKSAHLRFMSAPAPGTHRAKSGTRAFQGFAAPSRAAAVRGIVPLGSSPFKVTGDFTLQNGCGPILGIGPHDSQNRDPRFPES